LSLLSFIIAHKILEQFDLPFANLLSSAGGHFHILLPNTPGAEEKLQAFEKELDDLAIKDFGAEIRFHLAWHRISSAHLMDFSKSRDELNADLRKKKLRPLASLLQSGTKWNESPFLMDGPSREDERCPVCGKKQLKPEQLARPENERACDSCGEDAEMGSKMAGNRFVNVFATASGHSFNLFGCGVEFSKQPSKGALLALSLEPQDLGTSCSIPAYPFWVLHKLPSADGRQCEKCDANHCHHLAEGDEPEKGQPLFFTCLAARAKGRKYIGALKADVDNLGQIFKDGFAEKSQSISRFTTLSRMLDLFFSGWVAEQINEKSPFIYPVFSGGDDLFLIGPWDQMLDFAFGLRKDFAGFTAANPGFSFSAGLTTARPATPVNIIAERAEEILLKAKREPALEYASGRDQLNAFGQNLKWDDAGEARNEVETLAAWLDVKKLSVSFVRNLMAYGDQYYSFRRDNKVGDLIFLPRLAYEIARNFSPKDQEVWDWVNKFKNNKLDALEFRAMRWFARYLLMKKG
jgi:CRISPR-associated protein Csm1